MISPPYDAKRLATSNMADTAKIVTEGLKQNRVTKMATLDENNDENIYEEIGKNGDLCTVGIVMTQYDKEMYVTRIFFILLLKYCSKYFCITRISPLNCQFLLYFGLVI